MDDDQLKIKATDFVVESLKLIVTLSTIFLGGLLAYRSNVESPVSLWSYYWALAVLSLCAFSSIYSVNALINKLFKGGAIAISAIQHTEVKISFSLAAMTLLGGMFFSGFFLFSQTSNKASPISNNQTAITDTQIVTGGEVKSNIQVTKDNSGKVTSVTISPK